MMSVSFLNMNDECECLSFQNITCSLLTLTSAFSCARELRGVRRAFHRQFFCKYLSTSIIQLSLSLCLCIYDKKSDEGSNSVRMRHENRYASKKVHFTCFNTILALSLSSPCRTQLLPSSDFMSYDPGNMSVSFIAELSPVYCCLVSWICWFPYVAACHAPPI